MRLERNDIAKIDTKYPIVSSLLGSNKTVFLFLLFCSLFSHSQNSINISGIIYDNSDSTSLQNANVICFAQDKSSKAQFSISDKKGRYRLSLTKGKTYILQVSYIGFKRSSLEFVADKDDDIDFYLIPQVNELDEVILTYKAPITIKKDTIIYNVDSFVTGEERKLREVLKNLPGIEVDREGNVTAQGRKVTNLLVEDKTFFTGDTKLAVNNIPADAVNQVQLLERYNRISFLKGLEDSDEIALNIKLKEDKKRFVFGDIETGLGIEERFLVHPNVFYYSPNTTLNFIGDLNNIGNQSFTILDFMGFNGRFGKLSKTMNSYKAFSTSGLSSFLMNDNFNLSVDRFGALNFRQSLSPKAEINSYIIANSSDKEAVVLNQNTYTISEPPTEESRIEKNELDNEFLLGKIAFGYEPNQESDLTINTLLRISRNFTKGSLNTQTSDQSSFFNTNRANRSLQLNQNIDYSSRLSKSHIISLEMTFTGQLTENDNVWNTDEEFLEGLIPIESDSIIQVFQLREDQKTSFDFLFKDYWLINRKNHIYATLGTNVLFEKYETSEKQSLTNGDENDFSSAGFGNFINYGINDSYLGMEYKFLSGIFTFRTGLFYHYYSWENKQATNTIRKNTDVLLPEFRIEAEFSNSEKLSFGYRQRTRFLLADHLISNFSIKSFNSVIQGDPNLTNERSGVLSLRYYKYSLYRGLDISAGIYHIRKSQSIKNETNISGIEQFIRYTMFNLPENSISGNFSLAKKIGAVKLGFDSNLDYSEFYQLVNDRVSKNLSRTASVTGRIETDFEYWPNLELGYTYEPSIYTANTGKSQFLNNEFFVSLDFSVFRNLNVQANYNLTDYSNKNLNLNNRFDLADFSIYYQKEDNPWGFEISASNAFNTQVKRQNLVTEFIVSDRFISILPRILMLKVSYKL